MVEVVVVVVVGKEEEEEEEMVMRSYDYMEMVGTSITTATIQPPLPHSHPQAQAASVLSR